MSDKQLTDYESWYLSMPCDLFEVSERSIKTIFEREQTLKAKIKELEAQIKSDEIAFADYVKALVYQIKAKDEQIEALKKVKYFHDEVHKLLDNRKISRTEEAYELSLIGRFLRFEKALQSSKTSVDAEAQ